MKIGFILESGPDGAEQKILDRLIPKINSALDVRRPFAHNNGKHEMIASCGKDAQLLLTECDRVVIICDLGSERHKCGWQEGLQRDIAAIRASLQTYQVDTAKVRLLVIQEEIETWLVADHRAVAAFLCEHNPRKCTLKKAKGPQGILNPKTCLHKMFQGWRKRYIDLEHADGIAKYLEPQNIRHICSFVRFERLITDPDFACTRHLAD